MTRVPLALVVFVLGYDTVALYVDDDEANGQARDPDLGRDRMLPL